jgi:hypothetical protein
MHDLIKARSTYTYCLFAGSKHVLLFTAFFSKKIDDLKPEEISKIMYIAHAVKNTLCKKR